MTRLVHTFGGVVDLDNPSPASTSASNTNSSNWHLPAANWWNNVTDVRTLYETQSSPQEMQETVVAENDILRVVYGEPRIGPQVANILGYNGNWIIQLVWCWGGTSGIEGVNELAYNDSTTLPPGMIVVGHFTGTQVSANATLVAAFAANGVAGFADYYPGVAYSIIQASSVALTSGLNFTAKIKGQKVYDPRSGLTVWSKNASLCLADFIRNSDYGMGKTVETTSLTEAANWNDTSLDSKPRNTISLSLDSPRSAKDWIEVLRTYAEAFVVPDNGSYKIVADKPRSSVYTLSHTNSRIRDLPSLMKRDIEDVPTVVQVNYTDTSALPHRDKPVSAYASDDVKNGLAPWRESVVTLPGVDNRAEAYRHAVSRYNKLAVNDLSVVAECFDEAFQLVTGDVITLDFPPYGISNKLMQVGQIELKEPGRWSLLLNEYNDAAFSSAIVSPDDYPDTTLPSAGEVPIVTNLAMVEEYYQDVADRWFTRFKVTWTAPTWYYPFIYAVRLMLVQDNNGVEQQVWSSTLADSTFNSPPLVEAFKYRVYVAVRGPISTGVEVVAERTALVQSMAPTTPQDLTAAEAGGRVYMKWTPSVDLGTLRYEIRYGIVGISWLSATVIDRVDSNSFLTNGLPAGRYDFLVKAFDQYGNYSVSEARQTVTVLTDDSAFKALLFPTSGTLTWSGLAVNQYTAPDGLLYGVTDWGDPVNYGHSTVSNSAAGGDFDDVGVPSSTPMVMPHSRAHNFNGANWASIAYAAGLNVGAVFSFDCWIYPTPRTGTTVLSGDNCIWSDYGTTGPAGHWRLWVGDNVATGTNRVYISGVQSLQSADNAVLPYRWQHVAVTCSGGAGGSVTWRIYVDSVQVAQTTTGAAASNNAVNRAIGSLISDGTSIASYGFRGLISRARLWSVQLSAAEVLKCIEYRGTEVTTVVNTGGLVAANLKASWQLNDAAQSATSTVVDDEKNVSDGAIGGGADWRSWDEITSAAIEMGATYSGTFEVTGVPVTVSGTVRTAILLATSAGGPYYEYVGSSVTGVARYVKIKFYSEAGAGVYPLSSLVRVNLTPRSEYGTSTTLNTSVYQPRVITLTGNYSQALKIILQAKLALSSGVPQTPPVLLYDQVEVSGGRGLLAGRSLRFNGTSGAAGGSYVLVGDYADYEFTNAPVTLTDKAFTIECLTKFDSIGTTQSFISKGSGGPSGEWQMRIQTDGTLALQLYDLTTGGFIRVQTQTKLQAGVWYHFAATYAGANPTTGGIKLYVNAKEEPTIATTLVAGYVCMRPSTDALVIGNQYFSGGYNTPVFGVIDEVRIWNDVRTPTEIATYMNTYVPIGGAEDDGLVSYWKFDETTGFTAVDTMGLHNGTLGAASAFNGVATYADKWWRPYDGFDVIALKADPAAAGVIYPTATEFRYDYTGA